MSQLTKNAIRTSFIKLLNDKAFDKITVKDIVEDCGINRNTFYYHYEDIYELLDELFKDETKKNLNCDFSVSSIEEAFINSMHFVMQNKKAVYHIYNSIQRDTLNNYLANAAGGFVSAFVKKQAEGLNVSDSDIELIITIFRSTIIGLIYKWLDNDMQVEPENYIRRLAFLVDGEVLRLLEKAAQKQS